MWAGLGLAKGKHPARAPSDGQPVQHSIALLVVEPSINSRPRMVLSCMHAASRLDQRRLHLWAPPFNKTHMDVGLPNMWSESAARGP